MINTCYMRFPVFTTELRGNVFLILILDANIPKFTMSSLKKNWHQVKERWTSACAKQVILKPSNTVSLCYLTLNAFYVGFLVK